MLAGPFSQRVLLTLEEKKVPYEMKLVDLSNKLGEPAAAKTSKHRPGAGARATGS